MPVKTLTDGFADWIQMDYMGKKSAEILLETEYTPPRETWGEY